MTMRLLVALPTDRAPSARRRLLASVLSLAITAGGSAAGAQDRLGSPGGPVELAVGYQPYWPPAWSSVVQRARVIYARHLPRGSTVEFHVGLRGMVLTEQLASGELDLIYVGDVPAIAAAANRAGFAKIVAALGSSSDSCSILLVRSDTPPLPDAGAVVRWLAGKRVGVPRGSCAERFAAELLAREHVSAGELVDHSILGLERSLVSRRIDAAFVWEPSASRLERLGLARRELTGAELGAIDTGFLVASADLVRRRPDVLASWLRAELEAQLFLIDPQHAADVVEMAEMQTLGADRADLHHSLFASLAGGAARSETVFHFEPLPALEPVWDRLKVLSLLPLPADLQPSDLVVAGPARQALRNAGRTAPIGRIVPAVPGRDEP